MVDSNDPDQLGVFFAAYPTYNYNARAPAWNEFNFLTRHMRWHRTDPEYLDARSEFRAALVQDFNTRYGTDAQRLEAWQNLCEILEIRPVPLTITKCRKAIAKVHVNICDLIDYLRAGDEDAEIPKFKNVKELREYSYTNHKIFPKDDAKAGGLLKHLLRLFKRKNTY